MNSDLLPAPPHSESAEFNLLGGLMLDGACWVRVQGVITEHDFYFKRNKVVFRALFEMFSNDEAVDVITAADYLENKGLLESAGTIGYLADLVKGTPSAANVAAYANIIREKSLLRQLISVAGGISEKALAKGAIAKDIIAGAESAILDVAQQGLRGKQGFTKLPDILRQVLETMEDNMERPADGVLGVPSGFSDLDRLTSGFQSGDLVVVAARPSMGKTAFSMNIAEFVAITKGLPVAVFSMEMSKESLAMRILSNQSNVGLKKIREAWTIEDQDWPHFTPAIGKCNGVPLFVDDTPGLTVADIRSRCMRLQSVEGKAFENGLGMIVVDYIQLMGSDISHDSRNNQIEEITRGLKRLAKDFGIPVVALSQLNRKLESRPNRRPIMSDLRESGGIEQDADIILFLYRDEVYHEDSLDKGIAEVIISKQRNGALGVVRLAFDGECARFRGLSRDYEEVRYG